MGAPGAGSAGALVQWAVVSRWGFGHGDMQSLQRKFEGVMR